jgi:hypothetical protein
MLPVGKEGRGATGGKPRPGELTEQRYRISHADWKSQLNLVFREMSQFLLATPT